MTSSALGLAGYGAASMSPQDAPRLAEVLFRYFVFDVLHLQSIMSPILQRAADVHIADL